MSKNNWEDEARALAARQYSLFVFLDDTTDNETIYVATNLELKGCIAQGETVEEAEENLAEVRIDYIAHLLANNLTIPEPNLARRNIERDTIFAPYGYRILEPGVDSKEEASSELNVSSLVFA